MPRCVPLVSAMLSLVALPTLAQESPPDEPNADARVTMDAEPIRVSGEPEFTLETRTATLDDGTTGSSYVAGPMRVASPLPEGYPRPTAAGAMEIKAYPGVRRAELTVEASPRWGMNQAFFPLFRHIQKRDIAMTAPVEAELPAMARRDGQDQAASRTGEMTVSFLYRTGDMGDTGPAEEDVRVIDAKPVTVLAMGIRGAMDNDRIEREIASLYAWLDAQGEANIGPEREEAPGRWHASGPPRILGYNGPDVRRADQWWEVQLPVMWKAGASQ